MLTSAEFIQYVLDGGGKPVPSPETPSAAPLPEGFDGFEPAPGEGPAAAGGTGTFARRLLEAAGFGYAELVQRANVIRSSDAVARYLPERASYWPKTSTRPYQTLLFEASMTSGELLKIPAFRNTELRHLDDVEGALARLANEALEGFQRGGEGVTADVRKGRREETLCIVSIVDEREAQSVRLVCFGTWSKRPEGGFETFQITEQARFWDPQLAREHLGLLYERQFRKLEGHDWQEAFTTTEERKQAEKLLEVCTRKAPKEHDIQEGVLDLLDIIAKGFGLRKRPKTERRLQAFDLPPDHDIGIDPEERESAYGGKNPFGGVTLRDERSRLLGYIVYPLRTKTDAARLRKHLDENNRFHNVLVVYPDEDQASLELWQGREQLTGKLRKGQGYKDAADVVNLLSRFFVVSKAKVKNPTELAQELAYRARYLRRLAVRQLEDERGNGPLRNLYNAFKETLIHDQTEEDFADAFAQTITYGLLAARWAGNEQLAAAGERLTRQTALKHLPATSPFLNALFESVLAVRLDEQRGRFLWLVDDIADLLDRVNVVYVFGIGDVNSDNTTDPVIHFYEPFLAAYDKAIKTARGVFFTPQPLVSFIVRSVDHRLRTQLNYPLGLADSQRWKDGPLQGQFRVQILDPAVGTGTFLREAVILINKRMRMRWAEEGVSGEPELRDKWRRYVDDSLLPRICGFEVMMASYAICHLKLALTLRDLGYLPSKARLPVFLTNTLEPARGFQQSLFARFLTAEAGAAEEAKKSRAISVVVGNPPYAGHSANRGFFDAEVDCYKTLDGNSLRLGQAKWLHNDYVKFLRFAELLLTRTGCGVLGFVTDHSYLDNSTFIGLRASLLQTFQLLAVVNLHGNAKLNRRSGDGDEPVFDITQGVAVLVAVRTAASGAVPRSTSAGMGDLRGSRREKLLRMGGSEIQDLVAVEPCGPPYYSFLAPEPHGAATAITPAHRRGATPVSYSLWPAITDLFVGNQGSGKVRRVGTGFVSTHDNFAISWTRADAIAKVRAFINAGSEARARNLFSLCGTSQWSYRRAITELRSSEEWKSWVVPVLYRPFDVRWTVWDRNVCVHRRLGANEPLRHGVVALCVGQAGNVVADKEWNLVLASRRPVDFNLFYRGGEAVFPEKLVEESNVGAKVTLGDNWNREVVSRLPSAAAQRPMAYVYAVLNSRSYRRAFSSELSRDFPRIPTGVGEAVAAELVRCGEGLLSTHLAFEELPTPASAAPAVGTEVLPGMPKYDAVTQRVRVGREEAFGEVSPQAWDFRVGGYQPSHKWLKDRKGRKLSKGDVEQYQRMIVAISRTICLMAEIDDVIEKAGGWTGAVGRETIGG